MSYVLVIGVPALLVFALWAWWKDDTAKRRRREAIERNRQEKAAREGVTVIDERDRPGSHELPGTRPSAAEHDAKGKR